jgi:iron complex outermembrane receptor protein
MNKRDWAVYRVIRKLPLLGGLMALPFCAAAAQGASHEVDIEAGLASHTLRVVAEQTGIQILFQTQQVENVPTPHISGHMTGVDAVSSMLGGSGLVVSRVNPSTIAISVDSGAKSFREAQKQSEDEAAVVGAASKDVVASQAEVGKSGIPEILVKGSRSLDADIRRTEDDVQPYVVLDEKEIKKSGASDLQSFLNEKLTSGSPIATAQRGSSIGGIDGSATSFGLRGLGPEQTLVLVNGRRIASQAVLGLPNQPDLGGIPLAAIERIEVLPSTASGIFGGSATGGVINVILKQNYSGVDISASFDNTFKATAASRTVNISGGFSPGNGRTSIMIAGGYSEQSPLFAEDRNFILSSRERILRNNPSAIYQDVSPILGRTTNICSASVYGACSGSYAVFGVPDDVVPLTLKNGTELGSSITSVPVGYAGPAAAGDGGNALVQNAGHYNLSTANTAQGLGGGRQSLLYAPIVKSISATIRQQLTSKVDAFAEFAISENRATFQDNSRVASYLLDSSAPTNPFQQSILVTTPALGLDGENVSKISNRRAVAGLSIRLTDSWNLAGEYSWSSSRFFRESLSNTSIVPEADKVSAGEIDVIRDTNRYPVDLSSAAIENSIYGPANTVLKNPAIRLGGSLPFDFGGGRPSLAISIEYRQEELDGAYNQVPAPDISSFYPPRRQSVESVYTELRVPVVSHNNSLPGLEMVELQIAARHDRYKTVTANQISLIPDPDPITVRRSDLSSTDPTFGLLLSPLNGLTFRGSYGSGFLPPSLSQLIPSPDIFFSDASILGLVDPKRGNEPVTGSVLIGFGGNPELLPERARTWSYGIIFSPPSVPGIRVSIDRTRIAKRDNIFALAFQPAIDSESSINGLVSRETPTPQNDPQGFGVGPISRISTALFNFAKADVDAFDVAVDYKLAASRFGRLAISASGTKMNHNTRQAAPGSMSVESAGTISSLPWIAQGSVTWEVGKWSAGWQARYYAKYWLDEDHSVILNQGSATVPGQMYHDLFFSVGQRASTAGSANPGGGLLSGLSLQFGVKNVFNTKPPIVATDPFGYSSIGDPRLARYYLNIQKSL